MAREIPHGDDYPSAADLGDEPLWQTCPDEGAESLHLWDPTNPKIQRIRYTFEYGEFKGRVCTRYVREVPPGAGVSRSIGPACFPPRMQLEWFVREHVRKKGPMKAVDLMDLLPAHRVLSEGSQKISRDDGGRWYLTPPMQLRLEEWLNDVLNQGVPLPHLDTKEFFETVQILYEDVDLRPRQAQSSQRATLYVPIDLRLSVEKQWARQAGYVVELQACLLALSGHEGAAKIYPDVIKRRLRCLVLKKYGGLNARQIAAIVFPRERLATAAPKVRNEIRLIEEHIQKLQGGV